MSEDKAKIFFTLAAIILVLTQATLLFITKNIINYTILLIISSSIYFILVFLLNKTKVEKKELILIALIFLILKINFITINPIGSDDYYRYLWDGKVQVNGINPYKYLPKSAELNYLHSEILPSKVSYPHLKTIYLPVSQWIFALSFWLTGEKTIGLKFILLLFDAAVLLSLYYLLRRLKFSLKYLLIYVCMPLVMFQFFVDAHIDLAGIALMTASLAFYFHNKKMFSYVLLGLSISVKPTGLILIPFYFQNELLFREKIRSFFIPTLVLLLTFVPYIFSATPLDTLINYSVKWVFNGIVYNTFKLIISSNIIARIFCGVSLLFAVVYLYSTKIYLINKIYLSLFLLMIFSPVVHPWYLIWFAVLLPLTKSLSGLYYVSAVSLTFFTVVSYQTTGLWKEYPIVLLIEYIPVLALFIWELRNKKYDGLISPV